MAETKMTKPQDPWAEMCKIKLPRKPAKDANFEYVSVTGRAYQVPCGKEVEVPLPIYEVLMRQQDMLNALMDYQDSIPNEG